MKKKSSKAVLTAVMVLSVLVPALVLPAYAANEHVVVAIASLGTAHGDSVIVPITVSNVTDLGAGTLRILYKSSVCTVTNVMAGDLSLLVANSSVPGIVRISAMDFRGHTGDVIFAHLELTAVGSSGDSSPLRITVETLKTFGPPIETIPASKIRSGMFSILTGPEPTSVFDTGAGTYPSIYGVHNGTIALKQTITTYKMYTYPCPGTGGHAEYVKIWNESGTIAEEDWTGYEFDWHNITFNAPFTLHSGETYHYTIRTGSYPQLIHEQNHTTPGGSLIICSQFIDANGKWYDDQVPAIKFFNHSTFYSS